MSQGSEEMPGGVQKYYLKKEKTLKSKAKKSDKKENKGWEEHRGKLK